MTTPDPVAYWLAQLAAAERSADYARQQLAAVWAKLAAARACEHESYVDITAIESPRLQRACSQCGHSWEEER